MKSFLANNYYFLIPLFGLCIQAHLVNGEDNIQIENNTATGLADNQYNITDNGKVNESELEINPCTMVSCEAGKECYLDESTGNAKCECIKECGYESDPRRKVCTNLNETFTSDCAVHQLRCLCEEGSEDKCQHPEKNKHIHIEYFGECRLIPECNDDEFVDFPRRMREWLYNVMKELSERKELSYYYQQMEKEAQENLSKRWSNAAIWKWCDLDKDASKVKLSNSTDKTDNAVSRHELFPVRAPLQAMEHCIGKFLDQCDADGNHLIELKEWGKCLEIPEEEMEQKCEEIFEQ